MHSRLRAVIGIGVLFVACGGTKPPAATPTPESSASASTEASSPASSPAASASASKPAEPAFVRSPKSVISDPDATFLLAFEQTEVGKAAEEKCTASSKQDPKKRSECMARARERIQVAAMRFRKDPANVWWWETLKPKGASYAVLKKTQFEFGEEKDRSIVIKPKTGAPVTFDVPNDYTIVVKDPQHGQLTYEVRLSMTTTTSQ